MVVELQGIPLIENKAATVYSPEENETILSSTSFIITAEDKVSLNSSFDGIPGCALSDSSRVQIAADDNNRTTSEQLLSQYTIIFGDENKSDNLTLQESDLSLLQIIELLQNENDCASAATATPTIVTSTAGFIDTSCNEIIVENRFDGNETIARGLPDKSNSVPLRRVGDDGHLKGYFRSDVVFNLSHRVLSELEIEVLGK